MYIVTVLSLAFGILGVAFGLKCYIELHKWARQCQGVRIAIAYKRKVKLQAPLDEWLKWANLLDKDKDSGGRIVYSIGGTSVAITKRVKMPKKSTVHKRGPKTREGAWSAQDQTAKQVPVTDVAGNN